MVATRIVLVGDSDIAFWPRELLPSLSHRTDGTIEIRDPALVSGHPGATLSGVLPHLRRALAESSGDRGGRGGTESVDALVVVACAGENDIGEGLSLGKSVEALREFLDVLFLGDGDDDAVLEDRYLIFLGPKFEPWLEDDPSYKKKYSAMARAFGRCLENYQSGCAATAAAAAATPQRAHGRIRFVDCLTMFCGDTAHVPGARLGGRARAEPRYFASDRLHLGGDGYAVWKDVTEREIQQLLLGTSGDS